MKKIICYGDSNTFGYNPLDASRYDDKTRWTAILQTLLGKDFEVSEEGVCDRTGFVNNPKGFLYSAQRHFPKLISKTENADLIILALGTNDLQFQYDISFGAIEKGLEKLIQLAKRKAHKIIVIPPVILDEKVLEGYFNFQFDNSSIIKSKKAGKIYRQLSGIYGCHLFDINKFTKPSEHDGLHYDKTSHKMIAEKLCKFIKNL